MEKTENKAAALYTGQKFKKCEICAYHEAGHILFAYLCGYKCRHVELINDANEEGFTSIALIDYGPDAAVVSKFMGEQPDADHFRTLSLGEKLESIEVGRRLARIFLGGSVSAAVYNNGGNIQIPLPMQIDYTDLIRVEYIHYIFSEIAADREESFIEHGLQDALYTLGNINVWQTIVDLAARLLKHNQLDKNDIEECLEEHGIMLEGLSPTISPDAS